MKKILINSMIVLTGIFNIFLILKLFGVINWCWWIFTVPYILIFGLILLYYDLRKILTVREFLTYLYVLFIFILGIYAMILMMGDQRIESGSHLSYSGTVICTCPTKASPSWNTMDDLVGYDFDHICKNE